MASFDQLVISFLVDEVAGGFFADVPPGHVATMYDRLRGVSNKTWGPGLHFKLPFVQKVKIFNAQTLEYTIREGFNADNNKEALGDDPISAVTVDNVNIQIRGTILVRINKDNVVSLWENIGEYFVSKIVRPVSRSRVRGVVSQVTLNQINTHRHEVEAKMKEMLEREFAPKGLVVENVLLSDVTLNNTPQQQ
jgi:regulator of protease activity HflC (stomatin/prohibitin superfamily)